MGIGLCLAERGRRRAKDGESGNGVRAGTRSPAHLPGSGGGEVDRREVLPAQSKEQLLTPAQDTSVKRLGTERK